MIDILDIEASDAYAIEQLGTCMAARLSPDELADLDFALAMWNRSLSDADPLHLERYERARRRGELTPALVRSHLVTAARLSQTPERRAVLRWRKRIHALQPTTKRKTKARAAA